MADTVRTMMTGSNEADATAASAVHNLAVYVWFPAAVNQLIEDAINSRVGKYSSAYHPVNISYLMYWSSHPQVVNIYYTDYKHCLDHTVLPR